MTAIEAECQAGTISRDNLFCQGDFFGVKTTEHAIGRLHNYRIFRNNIIHANDLESFLNAPDTKRTCIDFMLYLVSEYSPSLFVDNLSGIRQYNQIGLSKVLDSKHADYLVRSIDEKMIKRIDLDAGYIRQDWKLLDSDFSNLLHLRSLLAPLKNSIQKWLETTYPKLTTTILTTIDTSSAYIWMPIVHNTMFNADESDDRPNLRRPSASILATPLDLRIYIDFGGQCHDERVKYFQFIREDEGHFRNFVTNRLDEKDRENFYIFDVEWYSFISEKIAIKNVLDDWVSFKKKVIASEEELAVLSTDEIITTNRKLSGFVFDRQWMADNGPIKIEFIYDKLTHIIDLYYSLIVDCVLSENGNKGVFE